MGYSLIEPIEREQLVSRFVQAHGEYLPQTLPDIRTLLELYYSDSSSQFPVQRFARYLSTVLPFTDMTRSVRACREAISSVTLLTAYAAASWSAADNHLAVAQAWLTTCVTLLRFACTRTLDSGVWLVSYELALEVARVALASLAKEAAEAEDLVLPDVVDGFVYSSRAQLVSGFIAGYFLSERTLGRIDDSVLEAIRTVVAREAPHATVAGESAVPALLVTACALGQLGKVRMAEDMMLDCFRTLARTNQRQSEVALADPYHEIDQVLLRGIPNVSGERRVEDVWCAAEWATEANAGIPQRLGHCVGSVIWSPRLGDCLFPER